jgi:hypothetical protein
MHSDKQSLEGIGKKTAHKFSSSPIEHKRLISYDKNLKHQWYNSDDIKMEALTRYPNRKLITPLRIPELSIDCISGSEKPDSEELGESCEYLPRRMSITDFYRF